MRVEMEIRNLPQYRLFEYLTTAGGRHTGDRDFDGDGWSATLQKMPPAQVGSIIVPRDLLVIEGQEETVMRVQAFMRKKTARGGG